MNVVLKRVSNFYNSEYLKQLICLMVVLLVAYKIFPFTKIKVLAVVVISLFAISFFLRIDWAICLFIFLCPFHYVFKEIYPSVVTDLWREVFVFCIIARWLLQAFVKETQLFSKDVLNIIIIAYILWGVMEIFHSINLLVGLAGFRFMFAFVPLYFAALSSIKGEKEIKKYINAILISGFIVAIIAIIQFVLLSLGIIAPGTSIDFLRKSSPGGINRLGFERVMSITWGMAGFLLVCILFVFVYLNRSVKSKHSTFFYYCSLIIMFLALLLSMSRVTIISTAVSILAVSILIKKSRHFVVFLSIVALCIIFLPFSIKALFQPVYTFSDPYYEGLKHEYFWNVLYRSPFLGHGFSITSSAAKRLGIVYRGVTSVGSVDNYFLQSSMQIGVIGFALHFFIWFLFLRNAYLSVKSHFLSENQRLISLAIFGALLGLMVVSAHGSPWEKTTLSGTYYVLGAITTFIYSKAKEARLNG